VRGWGEGVTKLSMREDEERPRPNLSIFGVSNHDAGFIYLIENNERYKIGRSKSEYSRIREAKTWLPDMKVIACKPFWNIRLIEQLLHVGFSRSWYSGEWFAFEDSIDRGILVEGLCEFSDWDRDWNSIDFIYWYNSSGLAEFAMERSHQQQSKAKFLRSESWTQKGKDI
jgi:hypothetical protein